MSTVQIEDDVKKKLFAVAAELQSELGKKVSLNEAIKVLLEAYKSTKTDKVKMLSLFGCLRPTLEARRILSELRAEEEEGDLERLTRKRDA